MAVHLVSHASNYRSTEKEICIRDVVRHWRSQRETSEFNDMKTLSVADIHHMTWGRKQVVGRSPTPLRYSVLTFSHLSHPEDSPEIHIQTRKQGSEMKVLA